MASIRKLESGNWRALIRRQGFPTMSATFKAKTEAIKWARAEEAKIDSKRKGNLLKTPKGSTFADFVDIYTEELEKIRAFGKNKAATLLRLRKEFESTKMSDMNDFRIGDFVKKRVAADPKISGVTLAIDLSYIASVMKWAKEVKFFDVDEAAPIRARAIIKGLKKKTKSRQRTREATKEELEKIFAAYEKRKGRQIIPMPDIIRFALFTAMRQEEICRIRIEDFDLKTQEVIIRERKDPENKEENDQLVPVTDEAFAIAMKYIDKRTLGRVFNVNHRSVSASFTRVCRECGIEDLHFHDLRHTATGMFFELGHDIPDVAKFTGHREWKSLQRYAHIKPANVLARNRELRARRKSEREELIEFLED